MVDPILASLVVIGFLAVLTFVHVQLLDRRKKRHKKWKKEHKAKEKRIEETFAEPDPEPDTDDKSGESGDGDSSDLPVQVEAEPAPNIVGGNSVHAPNESCRMCGRSDYSTQMVEIGDKMVCPRVSCIDEANRKGTQEAVETVFEAGTR